MTRIGNVYGKALYDLALEENLTKPILVQLISLSQSFAQESDFIRLLSAPILSKEERCQILDESFDGKLEPFVLNFLKILTEKGYMYHFSDCCSAYRDLYNHDNHILPVTAVTAVTLSDEQLKKLTAKLSEITGMTIELINRVDPTCLGGVRLDFEGRQIDGTVSHRLNSLRNLLNDTAF